MAGIDKNVVLYLRGDSFKDLSFNKNREITNVNSTIVEDINYGKCIELNTNQYIQVVNGMQGIDYSKDFTIEWWEYRTATATTSAILTNRINTNGNYARGLLMCHKGTLLYAGNTSTTTSWNIFSAVVTKSDVLNEWIHWRFVKKGNLWTSYKNGELFWSVTNTNVIGQTDGDNCTIGAWVHNSIESGYNARIRDFRIVNYAVCEGNFIPNKNHYNSISINILEKTDEKIDFSIVKTSPKEKVNKIEVLLNGIVKETYLPNKTYLTYKIDYLDCFLGENKITIRVTFDDIYAEELDIDYVVEHKELQPISPLNKIIDRFELLDNSIENNKNKLKNILLRKNVDLSSSENKLTDMIEKVSLLGEISEIVLMDEVYINNNGSFLNHTKTLIKGHEGKSGFAIVGTQNASHTANYMSGRLRCDFKIDFTKVTKINFYARKTANHGLIGVYISDGFGNSMESNHTFLNKIWKHYNDISADWTFYSMDTSNITGTRTLSFIGGYVDNSGNTSSRTEYSGIEIFYN